MKKVRIGKDIKVIWTIKSNIPLSSMDLKLELSDGYNRRRLMTFIVENSDIITNFSGKDQAALGNYSLTLWANYGKDGQTCVDSCDFVTLVARTCQEDDMGLEDLASATIHVTGSMIMGVQGKSAYESWVSQGHVGTEADFVAWIQKPALDAVDRLSGLNATVAEAEKQREASEASRRLAEGNRASNETTRGTNETSRGAAEQARVAAEDGRKNAETARVAEESSRVAAEQARVKSESDRAAAEQSRVTAEGVRNTDETKRKNEESVRATKEGERQLAEQGRVSAESSRVTEEGARVKAETARAGAEDARVLSENAREKAEQSRVSTEDARKLAENTRSSEETKRASNETARGTAETNRVKAEEGRVAAEQKRVDAEKLRVTADQSRSTEENKRAQAETLRVTAEQSRTVAESGRAQEESKRSTNEQTRVSAENTRKINEGDRQTNEDNRVKQEASRIDAENARALAESGRVKAETSRANAEQTRVTEWNQLKSASTAATQSANTAASSANKAAQETNAAISTANTSAANANKAAQTATTEAGKATTAAAEATAATTQLMSYVTEYNVSKLHPTGGIGGTNKYDIAGAIAKIPVELRIVGNKCTFVDDGNITRTYEFQGGNAADVNAWKQIGYQGIVDAKMLLFIDLWKDKSMRNGDYNFQTGFFELYKKHGGLTDITYEEALRIYNVFNYGKEQSETYANFVLSRTCLPHMSTWSFNADRMFQGNKKLEIAYLQVAINISTGLIFYMCHNLRKVLGQLTLVNKTCRLQSTTFYECFKLEYVPIRFLTVDVDLHWSPLLNLESFRYMVDNAGTYGTMYNPCTVTVHPDVYAKLTDPANVEWNKILTDGAAKQISFATK